MERELAQKWANALRSGQYKQGKTYLYAETDNTYCCLGVLYQVKNECKPPTLNGLISENTFDMQECYGLSLDDESAFIAMNDEDGLTFTEIADYIEATYCSGATKNDA